MEFVAVILTIFLYYVRPQEWMTEIQPLMPVTIVMALAVLGVIAKTRLAPRELLKTPHDWLMVLYCFWMIYTTPNDGEAFGNVYPLFLFYLVVVHALSDLRRLTIFLGVWTGMIFVIAVLALVAPLGFDPTDSEYATMIFGGRKALGTSIFRNPNALGHSVMPCVIMLYFLFLWRRPIFSRIAGLPLFAVPLYCIYLTLSKGAFISGFAAVVLSMAFGRPKYVQVGIIALALTGGWGAMQLLPRMNEVQDSKGDEAIQGRVAAFQFGLTSYRLGGFKGFGMKSFAQNMLDTTGLAKASHSSYVQVGAELGKGGFWLFLGVIYCCLRTLMMGKARNDGEERARRMLFAVLIAYLVSSWMVDFAYHGAFFFCAGAIAAYHRLLLSPDVSTAESAAAVEDRVAPVPAMHISGLDPVPANASPGMMNQTAVAQAEAVTSSVGSPPGNEDKSVEEVAALKGGILWNRLGLIDIGLIFVMQYGALRVWLYAIKEM